MLELNGHRIKIIQLDNENFQLLLTDKNKMEKNLGFLPTNYQLDSGFLMAMEMSLNAAIEDMVNFQWYTNWQIISKAENIIEGSIGFKGSPNQEGVVELGYGINENDEGQGFATEAVAIMTKWALAQKPVKLVIAETEKENLASQRVLEKNNFSTYKEVNNHLWWKFL